VLAGLFMGLAYAFVPSGGAAAGEAASGDFASTSPAGTQVADPWAASIVDGDTFRYRGEKYRIADIDTPEVRAAAPMRANSPPERPTAWKGCFTRRRSSFTPWTATRTGTAASCAW
jgi:endonuclease YncB( thermonuclease family)